MLTANPMMPEDDEYQNMLKQQLSNLQSMPQQEARPSDNQFVAQFADSANKLGTLGGKSTSAEPLQRYANVLDQMKAARAQQDMAKTDKQTKIMEALAQLKDKGAARQNEMMLGQNKLDASRQDRLARQDFDRSQQDRLFNHQTELEGLKSNERKVLANNKPPKEATADERTSAMFATRAKDAAKLALDIENSGYEPASYGAAVRTTELPLIGGTPLAKSDDRSYDQSKRSFISAVLRKESGAAISPQEYANEAKKYFPQAGDGPQQIAQKAAERERAIQTLITASDRAYDPSKQMPFEYKPEAESGSAYAATSKPAKSPQLPKSGDVMDGYRFKGGNPSDPKAWEEVE